RSFCARLLGIDEHRVFGFHVRPAGQWGLGLLEAGAVEDGGPPDDVLPHVPARRLGDRHP
ncbi:hypothetical protein, partial [Streptomyces sp. Agncl-13]|uniref:hypothetical protein n=1 Tax=Streptomyces sp. Agncl-13 TaxID=3400628 RepID=UPI003A8499D1